MKLLLKLLQKRYQTAVVAQDLVHNCSANTSFASFCSPLFTIFKAWKKISLKQRAEEPRTGIFVQFVDHLASQNYLILNLKCVLMCCLQKWNIQKKLHTGTELEGWYYWCSSATKDVFVPVQQSAFLVLLLLLLSVLQMHLFQEHLVRVA